jgi:hypothetical protein
MYYIMSWDNDEILETSERMSEDIIQQAAIDFDCDVYAIRGEHSGYTASRPTQPAPDAGDSAASSGIVQASAESTSQAESAPTQRG